ncbi:MAG: hypothetical protein IJC52_00480 [Clostridia bacterium]|nr:hypothetical protein [Clostridia bacterium]
MARDMALAGVDRSTLTPPPPPEKPKGFSAKCRNVWYHYKPLLIGGGLFLLLVLWLVIQTVTNNPPDYTVVVVTELPLLSGETAAMEEYLALGGTDLDGDGEIEVTIENLNPNFHDEMAPTIGHADMQKLMSVLATGEHMLFAFDKASYDGFIETVENVTDGDDYRFLAPIATTSSDYNADDGTWSWKNDARRTDMGLAGLPEDMVFGVRTVDGTADNQQSLALHDAGEALLIQLSETAE